MTDKELITKSVKVIELIGLRYDKKIMPSITKEYPEILLDAYPELKDEISIDFEPEKPNIGDYKPVYTTDKGGVTVIADKKTYKLLYVLTKSNMYEVPEELR